MFYTKARAIRDIGEALAKCSSKNNKFGVMDCFCFKCLSGFTSTRGNYLEAVEGTTLRKKK